MKGHIKTDSTHIKQLQTSLKVDIYYTIGDQCFTTHDFQT